MPNTLTSRKVKFANLKVYTDADKRKKGSLYFIKGELAGIESPEHNKINLLFRFRAISKGIFFETHFSRTFFRVKFCENGKILQDFVV